MRFLFVSDFLDQPDSGSAGSLIDIGNALERLGDRVHYVWHDPAQVERFHPRFNQVVALPRQWLAMLERRLREQPYDAIIASQPYAYLVFERLAPRYPRTVFLNRTHGWEDRLRDAERRLGWREESGLLHGLMIEMSARLTHNACVRTARAAAGIISPSSLCARYIVENYGIDPERVAVVPYGINSDFCGSSRSARDRGSPIRLLYAGQYLERKGTGLLEAMLPAISRRYPNMRITFVVPSDSVNRVHAVFDASFGDRLSVMPWMPRAQLRYVYSEHDILLFPSLFEGFGKVCLEAMSQAMCVVAFDEGGISDIAIANRDALYCKAGDYVRFRQLLRGAIENPEFAQEIGLAARSRVTTFTWDRTARRTRDFCEKLRGRYETKTARFARPNSSEALRAAANSAAKLQPH